MTIQMYDLCGAESDRRFSPFCWQSKFALAHKQLDYEAVAWKFTETEAIAAHGSKTVPVIVDGDTKVSDSGRLPNIWRRPIRMRHRCSQTALAKSGL